MQAPHSVCIVGASGRLGSRILGSFERSFDSVTGIVRPGDLAGLSYRKRTTKILEADIRDPSVARLVWDESDVVVLSLPPSNLVEEAAAAISRVDHPCSAAPIIFHVSQWDADARSSDPIARIHARAEAILGEL